MNDTTESMPADNKTIARDILKPHKRRSLISKALIKIPYLSVYMHKTGEILVCGYVQAVGFRLFTKRYADHFHITGFVQNQADGSVKVVASGDEADLVSFMEKLREGPRMAFVTDVKVRWQDKEKAHTHFDII